MLISFFPSLTAVHATEKESDFDGWKTLPLVKKESGSLWSPALFLGRKRGRSEVTSLGAVVVDLDHLSADAPEIATLDLLPVAHLIHTSWSHTPESPCLRLVIPLSEPYPVADHDRIVAAVWRAFPGADRACRDPSRIYFEPAHHPDRKEDAFVSYIPGPVLAPALVPLLCTYLQWMGSPQAADRMRADSLLPLLRGEPVAPAGERHETLLRLTATLAATYPDRTPDSLLALWGPSLAHPGMQGVTPKEVLDALQGARAKGIGVPAAADDTRPVLRVGTDIRTMADSTIEALAASGGVYQRGGILCDLVTRPAKIRPLDLPALRERVSHVARWEKYLATRGWVPTLPADAVVQALASRGEFPGVPELVGILSTPYPREDGSLHTAPGYDMHTKYYLSTALEVHPVTEPNKSIATEAAKNLLFLVSDFPWVRKKEHEVAWLAAVLTAVGRPLLDGAPSPAWLIDATTPGSGKTLLADLVSIIATGSDAAKIPLSHDSEEVRKQLFALALDGEPIVLFDNCRGRVGAPALDGALTSCRVKDRILGASETRTVPWAATTIITGNNLTPAGDLARRLLYVRLEPTTEHPELRSGWAIEGDLRAYAKAHRAELVTAALHILSAHALAGRPEEGVQPFGGFETWRAKIGAAVAWATGVDPTQSREDIAASDSDAELGATLVAAFHAWKKKEEWTCADLAAAAESEPMKSAIQAALPGRAQPNAASIGRALARFRGRLFGGMRLGSRRTITGRLWKVTEGGEAAPAEEGAAF